MAAVVEGLLHVGRLDRGEALGEELRRHGAAHERVLEPPRRVPRAEVRRARRRRGREFGDESSRVGEHGPGARAALLFRVARQRFFGEGVAGAVGDDEEGRLVERFQLRQELLELPRDRRRLVRGSPITWRPSPPRPKAPENWGRVWSHKPAAGSGNNPVEQ